MQIARVLPLHLACLIVCSLTFFVDSQRADNSDPEICVQGFSTAKRTLQATQRNVQHIVMSSAGKVGQISCAS